MDSADTAGHVEAPDPVRGSEDGQPDKARCRQLETQLAEYRDALTGMAAELREFDKIKERHEREKAELAARIADLERQNAALNSQRKSAEAATRQSSDQLAEAIRAVQAETRAAEIANASQIGEVRRELEMERRDRENLLRRIAERDAKLTRLENLVHELEVATVEPADGDEGVDPETALPRNGSLMVSLDGDKSVKHPLFKPVMVIGRSSDTDIRIAGPRTSRRHARLFVENGTVTIEDMGSLNGTTVNDALVRRQELRDGDVLDVGGARLQFVSIRELAAV